MRSWFLMGICLIGRVTGNLGTRTYSCRSPITTCASVEAFTLLPLRIARIVLRSSPVSLVVFRNPRAMISATKLSLAMFCPRPAHM